MHLSACQVDEYALGRTAEDDISVIEEHLLVCKQCQREITLVELIMKGLRDVKDEAEEGGLTGDKS